MAQSESYNRGYELSVHCPDCGSFMRQVGFGRLGTYRYKCKKCDEYYLVEKEGG